MTGWQRAAAGEQAFGEPVSPPPEPSTPTNQAEQEEAATLKDQAADLSRVLDEIQSRLADLEKKAEENPAT